MAELSQIVGFYDHQLAVNDFKDYIKNGLIVDAQQPEVNKVAFGVSLTEDLIRKAIKAEADLIVVHHAHGFWQNQLRDLTGALGRKVHLLMDAGISVIGYHLPLDASLEWGNNARLLQCLKVESINDMFMRSGRSFVGRIGKLKKPVEIDKIQEKCELLFGRDIIAFKHGKSLIERIAVCTGGAPDEFTSIMDKADLYITGEAREHTMSRVKENDFNFFACGHHATERLGVQALASDMCARFNVMGSFYDEENPV